MIDCSKLHIQNFLVIKDLNRETFSDFRYGNLRKAMLTSDSSNFYNSFINLTAIQVYLKMVDTVFTKTTGDGSDREVVGIYIYGGVSFNPKTTGEAILI